MWIINTFNTTFVTKLQYNTYPVKLMLARYYMSNVLAVAQPPLNQRNIIK